MDDLQLCAIGVSASAKAFVSRARNMKYVIIADEVHVLGTRTSQILEALQLRIGLSTLPERFGHLRNFYDKYFSCYGKILHPISDTTCNNAKKEHRPLQLRFWSRFFKWFKQENWDQLTKRISRLIAQGYGQARQGEEHAGSDQLSTWSWADQELQKKPRQN